MPAELTINEAAHLAGVSSKLIEKSVESGILHAEKVTDVLTRRLTRRLPLAAVPFLSAINDEWLRDLPVARKRRIWTIVSRSLEGGDTVADLVEDYPGIPEAAFLAAATYARTHPLRGRPSGRPWVPDTTVRH